MERIHRIFSNGNRPFKDFLDRAGIEHKYEESIVGKTVFLLISESDPQWHKLSERLAGFDVFHSVELKFSKAEIASARWCQLFATGHFGYPQPEDDFEYQRITYRPGSGCEGCGAGLVQVAPFRLKKTPTQRHSTVLQLNWVFDEFFVSSAGRAQLVAAGLKGFEFESPVLHKTGAIVPGWFQMKVRQTFALSLVPDGLKSEKCSRCLRVKYNYPQGHLPTFAGSMPDGSIDVVKTSEWFGSGFSAHRPVLVSQRFVRVVLAEKWRGVSLWPVLTTE